jgi:hypothetical protein
MPTHVIGILKEFSLHAEIKNWYSEPCDLIEIKVEGFLIDIVRGDMLIEIQTGHFYSLRNKLTKLLPNHPIRLVYPIPILKWITRYDAPGSGFIGRRRSPKKGQIQLIFDELVYLPGHVMHPNLTVEVLLIEQEDIWVNDGKGSWRRHYWSIADRKLISICGRRLFTAADDYLSLLPIGLPSHFSSKDVSDLGGFSQGLARKILYCLFKMDLIKLVSTQNRRRYYSCER